MRSSNITLFLLALFLSVFGILIIFSASAHFAYESYGDSFYFVKRQAIWLLIGLAAQVFVMRLGYHKLYEYSPYIFAGCVFLLLLVLVPGISAKIGGARRWIRLGPFSFQPSEFMKIAIIIAMAKIFSDVNKEIYNARKTFLKPVLLLMSVLLLIAAEKDLGTCIIIAFVTLSLFFVAGIKKRYLVFTGFLFVPFLLYAILKYPFRMRRITAFVDPWKDPQNTSYQIIQSLIAVTSGGWFGKGWGEGVQKYYYLPEAHTDFIFSIFAEETGFFGCLFLMLLFLIFIIFCVKITMKAVDRFGSLLAIGLTTLLGIQFFINVCVVTSLLPTKGTPLPFISFGGSSLVVNLVAVGILISIERYSRS